MNFKKLVALCIAFSALMHAQSQFNVGSKNLNLGIGFGGYLSYSSVGDFSSSPTLFASYDQGIIDNIGPGTIGIGGFAAFKTASYNYDYFSGYRDSGRWTDLVIGARGTYHYPLDVDKLDVYGILNLGLVMETYKYTTTYPGIVASNYNYNDSFLYYAINVGATYQVSPKFGVFAEVGYDIAWLKAGINLKPTGK
ncbi:MAG: hypothetical protein RIR06_669 [Bacteroidota bacterium]|jgi:hypothetical protein